MILESLSNQIQMKREKFLSTLVEVRGPLLQGVSRSCPSPTSLPTLCLQPPGPPPASPTHCCPGRGTWHQTPSFTENPETPSGGCAAEDPGEPEHDEIQGHVQRRAWARTVAVPLGGGRRVGRPQDLGEPGLS